jgi:hypothetical protein
MTLISSSAADAATGAAPQAATRNAALDHARTFLTMLVLIHHSVIAYTYFGHTDREAFLGFDAVVWLNDSFFMSAMFLLSGLFVWPSLQRKGVGGFLRDRCWRIGLPFAGCALILMPIAYYAVELRQHDIGFTAFWWKTITVGPWHSGPAWFVAVLLAFDVLAVAVYCAAPAYVEAIGRLSVASFVRPTLFFLALVIGSILVYVPSLLYFGAARWFTMGPLAIQASRVLHYSLYFFAGVGIGTVPFGKGLLARDGGLARRWPMWSAATIAAFACMVALIYVRRELLPDVDHPPLWWRVPRALTFVFYCAAQTFNVLALFLRFSNDGSRSVLDPLRDSAYGIYLIHYIPVLWLQYALFGVSFGPVPQLTAIIKAIIVFTLTLASSWAATTALRKIPEATRVL